MVQLSHPYMTIGKPIAFTIQTFVGKVTSLLFNMLSRFVIAFLPRSKCLRFKGLDLVDRLPEELIVIHELMLTHYFNNCYISRKDQTC